MSLRSWAGLAATVWAIGLAPLSAADKLDMAALYEKCVRSTVLVVVPHKGKQAQGSGSLIDAEKRLVLTEANIVGKADTVFCLFPVRNKDGSLISERKEYLDRVSAGQACKGTVLYRDLNRNLVLVKLDKLPPDTPALPLAKASPKPGARLIGIGNLGKVGSMFSVTEGMVRAVDVREFALSSGEGAKRIKARVITHSDLRGPRDSGGPWIDREGNLVGVDQSAIFDGPTEIMGGAVDVTEVRAFLADKKVKLSEPIAEGRPKK